MLKARKSEGAFAELEEGEEEAKERSEAAKRHNAKVGYKTDKRREVDDQHVCVCAALRQERGGETEVLKMVSVSTTARDE